MKQRKTPMRKCIVCQENEDKRNLFRVVRSPEGNVSLDLTGKKNGRGAYISKSIECIENARAKKLLNRHLKADVSDLLYDEMNKLVQGESK